MNQIKGIYIGKISFRRNQPYVKIYVKDFCKISTLEYPYILLLCYQICKSSSKNYSNEELPIKIITNIRKSEKKNKEK